jgi:hypothetical protein
MRFPAGLRARLLRRRLLHGFKAATHPCIFHLSPSVKHFSAGISTENLPPELEWHSVKASVQAAREARTPIVWLGGTEPLFHPAIGEVSAALADSGMYVFLHTSGVELRKRIHEFKPVDRLYLTLEVPPCDAAGPEARNVLRQIVPLPAVLEAIRVARLSGFHICAHFTVGEKTSSSDIAARLDALQAQHLDGIAVSSGSAGTVPSRNTTLARTLASAMRLIPSSGWRSFSRLLEASYAQIPDRAVLRETAGDRQTSNPEACEETA